MMEEKLMSMQAFVEESTKKLEHAQKHVCFFCKSLSSHSQVVELDTERKILQESWNSALIKLADKANLEFTSKRLEDLIV